MPKMTCNPVNIHYRFQLLKDQPSHREAADPSVIWFMDQFFMFPSKSGGFWTSDDLVDWTFHHATGYPVEQYAPDVCVVDNEYVYLSANSGTRIYRTRDPFSNEWEEVTQYNSGSDPAMIQDDDGRIYQYWGLCHTAPIWGAELDPKPMAKLKNGQLDNDQDRINCELIRHIC